MAADVSPKTRPITCEQTQLGLDASIRRGSAGHLMTHACGGREARLAVRQAHHARSDTSDAGAELGRMGRILGRLASLVLNGHKTSDNARWYVCVGCGYGPARERLASATHRARWRRLGPATSR